MYKRRDTSKPLSTIIGKIVQDNNLATPMLEAKAAGLWKTVLGPTVNNATSSVYVKDGKMFVTFTSSVVRHQLYLQKDLILQRINEEVGAKIVHEIIFR